MDTIEGPKNIYDANGEGIAYTEGIDDETTDTMNARLFVAAPALLACCREFLHKKVGLIVLVEQMKAVYQEATVA
jgi:protein required for attachment to host cells